jgi:RHS repeat-associated protein
VGGSRSWGYAGDGGPAIDAAFEDPQSVAVDAAGNLYIADTNSSVVRKVNASTGIITTLAGTGTGGYSGDGGPATGAQLLGPKGIALDPAGNVYIADNGNEVIRKVNVSTGIITTFAGKGWMGYSGDGGLATNASLSYTLSIAFDGAGNLYIADMYYMVVRKVSAATGIISTVAGNGTAGYSGDGGPATSAELNWPYGIAVDPLGNIYVADFDNNVIRKVTAATGIITTIVGNGTSGYSGDSGPALSAELNAPYGVALDVAGNLYILDSGNQVERQVSPSGTISTVAGDGVQGFSGDGGPATSAELSAPAGISVDSLGNLYIADSWNLRVRMVGSSVVEPITSEPVITWGAPATIPYGTVLSSTQLNATANVEGTFTYEPAAGTLLTMGVNSLTVVFSPTDTTHYSTAMATVPLTVTQATPIITWPTPAPIPYGIGLSSAQFNATANVPGSFTYTPAVNEILGPGWYTLTAAFTPADMTDYTTAVATVKLTVSIAPTSGIITTIAGNAFSGDSGDSGLGVDATFGRLWGVAYDPSGNIYISDIYFGVVRKLTLSTGIITTVAGDGTPGYSGDGGPATSAQLSSPLAMAFDTNANLYIADGNVVRKVTASTGVITTVTGTGTAGGTGDGGPATSATMNGPSGIAVDTAGNIYIADGWNALIRKVTASTGIITAIAGNGMTGYSGDGGAATSAQLGNSLGLAVDGAGNIYIGDSDNNVIREIAASTGIITTIAGNGTAGYSGDGGAATAAELSWPYGITLDSAGNLYIADVSNNVVRMVNASTGIISTVAGNGTPGFSGDGGPALDAQMYCPNVVAVDAGGNFYIADEGNNRVRMVGSPGAPPTGISVSPTSATLYSGQTQQFTALYSGQTQQLRPLVVGAGNGPIAWSINPVGVGSINGSGLYTAPATISSQEQVIITATSQTNSSLTGSATVTLMPPVAVSVTPTTATLTIGGQQQQYSATVIDSSNSAVTWTSSPSGVGTIDQTGLYTAPSSITSQQTVTVIATSQFDPTKSASAVITLSVGAPPTCASSGYSFVRAVVIDHTKVPNTDQVNFPFLFNTADPLLATTADGGHVTNPNGYDIIFTSDPAGQNPLRYEMEEYNPVTGQVVAWVQIPGLSHTSDTVIYLFYGNSNVTTSQQNPSAVWDLNYMGVWHLPNGTVLSGSDSTTNGNNGSLIGARATTGMIDGGLDNPSSTSGYINLSSTPLATTTPSAFTLEAWVNVSGMSGWPAIVDFDAKNSNTWGLYVEGGSGVGVVIGNSMPWLIPSALIPAGWNHIIATWDTNGPTMYLNGVKSGEPWNDSSYGNSVASAAIGLGYGGQLFNGLIDEVRVSSIARSSDWIATEYANQSSPSTFYQLYAENFEGVVPSALTLYSSQSEQFIALKGCETAAASWSIPSGSPGTLTTGGMYIAPSTVATQQTVSITATNRTDGSTIGTSVITLDPILSISVIPAAPTLYVFGETVQFTPTVSNAVNNAVTWSINPANMGSITQTGLYTAPSFSQFETVTITATSVQDATQSGSATLTLMPVIVTPSYTSVFGGFSYRFAANVPVVWSLAPGGVGTIDQTGLYTVPINGPFAGIFNPTYVVATAQADPNASYAAQVYLYAPIMQAVTPSAVSLIGGQSQAFNVCLATSANNSGCQSDGQSVANWSISPAGAGTIPSSGIYKAPPLIATNQTVTVTATDIANSAIASMATIALLAPVVSVTPRSVTGYPDQRQQFTAVVDNSSNTAVSWSISPVGAGTIDQTGLYTAPPSITSQQNVTVTVASQAIPSISASAVITLLPAQCPAKAYSYVRSIVIDHTKVPSSDQANFPFYFAVTDPLLASAGNGGHVTSTAGNDIVFSSDPAGLQPLSFDLEQYNPATGQIAAWVRVPVLSHSEDTVIYMFYGNPAITAPQQNPVGVWDSNYTAVYQFENLQNVTLLNSTINGNNASSNNVQETTGQPGAAGVFDGATSYIALPTSDFASFPNSSAAVAVFNASFGVWFKSASSGVILGQTSSSIPGGSPAGYVPALYIDTNGYLRANFLYLQDAQQIVSPSVYNDNNWHHAVLTFETNATQNTIGINDSVTSTTSGIETVYVDGQVMGSQSGAVPDGYASAYSYYLGTGNVGSSQAGFWPGTNSTSTNGWFYFNGSLDEVEVSSIARSSGWVQAEYNNQSSPSTFFTLGTEAGATPSLNPLAVILYGLQSQQFTLVQTGLCSAGDAVWSMPAGGPGTLSSTGLYAAPATINTQHAVTVTATTLGSNSTPVSATVTLMPPVAVTVVPGVASLPAAGTQQFAATVANATNTAVTWTLDPVGVGSISTTGIYTAPPTLSGQQTVSIIATSVADPTQSASATVTLGIAVTPSSAVTINPTAATLSPDQTWQFTATVTNEISTAVTWSVSPAGAGTIGTNGLYTAPASITAQQSATITATSQADTTQSASAMVTLSPNTCDSAGYGYQRILVIDHTKVPNTDQINYPFLFNSIDPDLATVNNGGHVANPNGYDIIFSTDPNGQTRLDFEIEQYNPATGQLVAWMRIPTLSHSSDTIIYVFYGDPAITTSQANPAGVWDSSYQAVYHLGSLPATLLASDSTNYANNASFTNLTAVPGQIDGSAALDGATSFLEIPSTAFPSYPTGIYSNIGVDTTWNNTAFTATFGIWFKTSSWGGLLNQTAGDSCGELLGICLFPAPEQPGTNPYGSWASLLDVNFDGYLEGRGVGPSMKVYNDDNWHYAAVTFENGVNNLYADGELIATGSQATFGYSPNYAYFVGTEDAESDTSSLDTQPWKYLPGQIDEISVSSTARSSDWIQTQYNNQSSPSPFYTFYSPNAIQVAPSSIGLYAAQSEQFTVPGTCDATITWSVPAGSPGTLTSSGLYTAPSPISSQQSITVSAISQSTGSSLGSAQITLQTTPQPLNLVASSSSPYQVGSVQSFTATLLDPQGNPQIGVTVNFTVAGVNATVGSVTTSSSGTASFTYTGSNSGSDTVQAAASVNGALLTSNSVTAAWLTPPPAQAPTITLLPQPSPGRGALVGAFTDNNGDVVEPIVIGTAARTFVIPAGATRLQLGINDDYYEDNGGVGFVVAVNGSNINVPPTSMPWNWQTGGLNNSFQYGINDGASPVIAAASLTAGQAITVAYQSGTVSTDYGIRPPVNANGETGFITGTQLYLGTYFPTLYTTGTAYPQNQPIDVFAVVTDATGAPIPNAPVMLTISGANPGQYQATSDATGTASFLYSGQYAANDSLQAQATLSGQGTLTSNQTIINWTNYPTPPPVGSLSLNEIVTNVNSQSFSSFARDASGNALPNENVGFFVTGVDNFQTSASSNNIGQAYYVYNHTRSGNYSVVAVDSVDRNVIVTQPYTGTWTLNGAPTGTGGTISIGISADTTVTMPTALQLNGTVTDSSGASPTVTWTEISGPGTVSFSNANQPTSAATFSQIGTYVVQLYATDTVNTGWAQFTVAVEPPATALASQGWIGNPVYGSAVTGIVPINLAPGVTLASGTLSYMPANNTNSVTVINQNVNGSGQIGILDTTALPNGPYWIQMQATDTSGNSEYSLIPITVSGNYKPGRVTTTVTDLVVPATGLSIQIQRTYDSLNASTIGDFGYGWNLGINLDLVVDSSGNVTFTLGGQRKTFNLTPAAPSCTLAGCLFPYYFVAFTPQPGAFGTLADSGSNCPLDIVAPSGSLWGCYNGGGLYAPSSYVYTDPNGTAYNISAGGALQSVTDKNGNGLTITPSGITSTTGLNVPFVRDSQNRITQITDPQGEVYLYQYDTNGNLATVTYPPSQNSQTCSGAIAPNTSQYSYYPNAEYPNAPAHFYAGGTDGRCDPLPATQYYASGETDQAGNSVSGKLQSVTDAAGEITSYVYNLSTNTTVVTYPPDANHNSGTATMVYDSNGDVLSSTDPLGLTTTNSYNANFNLLSTTDPLGHSTSYTYDPNGNKTAQTYPATGTSTNTTSTTYYNQYSEPTATTDELGNVRTFNYDASYNPASVTDSLGALMSTQFNGNGTMAAGAIGYDITPAPARASQFTYDANGNLASKTDALGRTTSYTYNALGQKATMTEPIPAGSSAAAATTTYTYDAFGNLIETQAPLGRTTSSTYDSNGNKLSDTDARDHVTNYKYDALNRLVETDYPDGSKKTIDLYDFRNNVVHETDQNGNVTLHVYDLAGRQVSVTQAYGTANATTTSYAYDNAGRKTSETDALGHATTYTYDPAGNLRSTSGVKGNFSYAYDNARNQISVTDGNSNTTHYAYDARKRLTVTTYPDQTTKVNAYDGPGNLALVTDQAQHQVQYSYDAANQLINVVQLSSPNTSANTTVYGYDSNGNPIELEDANTHITGQYFNVLNELTQKTLPDATHTESRAYDSNGNLQSVTHFNGVTTTYSYDALNRLLSRATPGETTVSFTYTATGKRQTMTDASGTTTYSYDSMDRLSSKATPEGTLSYTYDAAGNLALMNSNHTHGVSATYGYDDLNRLTSVVDSNLGGSGTTSYSYDSANNLGTVKYPNGIETQFTYDLLNRVATASNQVSSYTYGRGPTGNLTSALELNGRTVNWTYDGIYRLTNESIAGAPSGDNGAASYTLDPVGNRDSVASSLGEVSSGSWGYNSNDEVSSETYDANGNVLSTGGKAFTYDSENHLMSMTSTGKSVGVLYDGDGNRVGKTVNGVATYYLVDDLNPTGYPQVVEELAANGAVERQYTYGLQRISQRQFIDSAWTPSFYGYDGGGNVRNLTGISGTVTDSYEYDAYGNHWTVDGSTPNNMLYQGEEWDPDLSLVYLRARYMNPLTGRFLGRDPEDGINTDPKTLHKYIYAGGDPINFADPSGRAGEAVAPGRPAIGGALGEAVVLTLQIAVAAVAAVDAYACAVNIRNAENALGVLQYKDIVPAGLCSAKGRPRKCKPCDPPVEAGDYGYQLHIGQKSPHYVKGTKTLIPAGQTHWHLFQCNQTGPSEGCVCRWNKIRDLAGVSSTPPGFDVDTTACTGGGVEE